MAADRLPLNFYWCAYHWRHYARAPEEIQTAINQAVPTYLWTQREFRDAVKMKLQEYGQIGNAAKLVVIDWTKIHGKSMCCILGDEVMLVLLHDMQRRFDIPLPS